MEKFEVDELAICVTRGATTKIEWIGISDARDPSAVIDPFLDKLVTKLEAERTVVDFRALKYINSPTVTTIVKLVRLLDAKKIKTEVIYDQSIKWQQSAFSALNAIARMLKYITVEGK